MAEPGTVAAPAAADAAPIVVLRGLGKHYREGERVRTVLDDLGARIGSGEIVALLGRSGAGKSTLLNLIAGIDTPDAGEVRVAGASLGTLTENARTLLRRRHIGFVFQFFNLVPTLTALENVLLPLELNGLDDAAARAGAETLLARVGLADRADAFPDRLSGGEQQRVAIVRALVHRPRLVLADEPTGNLDVETGRQVLALLVELARSAGMTLLLVTHSQEVARAADRVLWLDHGRLIGRPLDAPAPV